MTISPTNVVGVNMYKYVKEEGNGMNDSLGAEDRSQAVLGPGADQEGGE